MGLLSSLDEPTRCQGNDGPTFGDLVGESRDNLERDRCVKQIRESFKRTKLKARERYMIASILEGMTLKEIGEDLGITESRASQIVTAVFKRMRNAKRC